MDLDRGKSWRSAVELSSRTTWTMLLDWGVITMTLLAAGASTLSAIIAFRHADLSAMAEAVLATGAALCAAWLGRAASRAAKRWQAELVAWHGNDITLLLDASGAILDANDRAEDAYGFTHDELCRRHLSDLAHADAPQEVPALLAGVLAKRRDVFETVQRHGNGSPFFAETSARVVEVRGRTLVQAVIRDVTDAHRAREQLVAAERLAAVGSVAAAMAHDINNPLCGVQGNVTYALDVLADPAPDLLDVRNALRDAHDSSKRVRDLVRDLNAFANGFVEFDAATDLRATLTETLKDARSLVERRCRIVVDVPPLPRVAAPAARLVHVFTIAIRDAARAMPEGDPPLHEIRITARADGPGHVLVEIADDGPPIHREGPPTAPHPFNGQPNAARNGGASLAAVIGMVRGVGGDVVADSSPTHGNMLRLRLPIAAPASELGGPARPTAGRRARMGMARTPEPRLGRFRE